MGIRPAIIFTNQIYLMLDATVKLQLHTLHNTSVRFNIPIQLRILFFCVRGNRTKPMSQIALFFLFYVHREICQRTW